MDRQCAGPVQQKQEAVMAMTTPAFAPSYAAEGRSSFATRIAALRRRFQDWRLYRQTMRELSELNNADLSDIGISRGEIRSIAWHAVYGA
ncbi:MAG: hypothetical protein ACJA1L_002094 [Paracoccaceae bacterium]|jgi:uncharacterized protein YjiS (DUF1127 family)